MKGELATGLVHRSHGGFRMTQKTVITLEDDLDGGPADETLRFGIDGRDYEIDLSRKNANQFRRLIGPFIGHARRTARGPRRPVRTAASRRRSHDIREWAMEHGIEVSDRGRIPSSVIERYEAAAGRSARSARS